jgi:3-isopropylmalate dehydrogenase
MTQYNITVVPGDGIGKEVCDAALQVLEAVQSKSLSFVFKSYAAGAQCYLDTGNAYPDDTREACRQGDAVLHGASGVPGVCYPDGTEAGQDFVLQTRVDLDLYANVRPIRLFDGISPPLAGRKAGDIDYIIVSEGNEGLYASRGAGVMLRDEVAVDQLAVTRTGVTRIVKLAAGLARRHGGAPEDGAKRLTIVDKANVLRSFAFFRKVATETVSAYPDLDVEYALTDAMSLHMVQSPSHFNVVVTENFVGDLLSDLGAATIGGLGLAPSAEIGEKHALFQSAHGSAPSIAGKNIANPIATILSAAMMLDWLGDTRSDREARLAAERIRAAVDRSLQSSQTRTRDVGGTASTSGVAETIKSMLAN